MKWAKTAAATAWLVICGSAMCQDITADEMIMLDKLRASYESQGLKVTPEQEARMLQRIRALKAAATGSTPPGSSQGLVQQQIIQQATNGPSRAEPVTTPATVAATQISEEAQLARVQALPAGGTLVNIEYLRDGVKANGKRFADPEGRISAITLDALTGTAVYLAGDGDTRSVKLAIVGSAGSPLTLGRVRNQNNTYRFESETGKVLSGDTLHLLTDGILLMRDSVGFRYTVGQGVSQIDIPKGWYPAALQRGNLAGTGWLLLEKDTEDEKNNPIALIGNLGKAVGFGEFNEYALMNMKDGRIVLFDISNTGKKVYAASQCRKKNAVMNVCEQVTGYNSLWEANGSRNASHYFWRIDWQKTATGSMAIALESGVRQVNAYDLDSGKKVNLFERTLGVSGFQTDLTAEGKWKIRAGLGFDTGNVDDIYGALQQRPDIAKTGSAGSGGR